MADNEPNLPGADSTAAQHQVEVDQDKLQALMDQMKREQSIPRGLLAGIVAGAVAAIVWALITKVTGYEVGWIAVGVGFLVGLAVRQFGKGIDVRFNIMGAVIALLSVMFGKVLAICMFAAKEADVGAFEIFNQLTFEIMFELLKETFHALDLLFYGLAVWAGWQYATRTISQEELAGVLRPKPPVGPGP